MHSQPGLYWCYIVFKLDHKTNRLTLFFSFLISVDIYENRLWTRFLVYWGVHIFAFFLKRQWQEFSNTWAAREEFIRNALLIWTLLGCVEWQKEKVTPRTAWWESKKWQVPLWNGTESKKEDQEQKGSLWHIYIPCCFCQDRLRLGIELGMRTIWPDVEISEKCVCM